MATGSALGVSVGPGVFTGEDFQRAAQEVVEPDLSGGWEFFVESHNTKIYRNYKEVRAGSANVWG